MTAREDPPAASDPHDPLDAALVRRMAAGDAEALGVLYDRWAPRIHPFVAHLFPDADDTEGVLEDVFACLWARAPGFREGHDEPSRWIRDALWSCCRERFAAGRPARAERSEQPQHHEPQLSAATA